MTHDVERLVSYVATSLDAFAHEDTCTPLDTGYGWDNPAPGTRLWRLRNHPDTLSREDAVLVAQDLAVRLAKERDQG